MRRLTFLITGLAILHAQEERVIRGIIPGERPPVVQRSENLIQIKGRIVDKESKEPLVGAAVRLQGTQKGVLTQLDGSFTLVVFPNEMPKNPQLTITYIGYEERNIPLEELE
ncbi:MAG: carboxypeptidase-like regulatory domain-containing protein, partial [Nitrososphaerota archaeon]